MSRRYVISNAAGRDMRRMEFTDRERVFAALDLLIGEPPRGDVRKLTGRRNEYRLRVGDWRVRFTYETDASSPMSRLRADTAVPLEVGPAPERGAPRRRGPTFMKTAVGWMNLISQS